MNAKRTAIYARVHELMPHIEVLQKSYDDNFGMPYQGLASHAEMPDGLLPKSTDMKVHPNDQKHNYEDFLRGVYLSEPDEDGNREECYRYPEAALVPFKNLTICVRFNVSMSPEGPAWEFVGDYDDGEHWRLVWRMGASEGEWFEIKEENLG